MWDTIYYVSTQKHSQVLGLDVIPVGQGPGTMRLCNTVIIV